MTEFDDVIQSARESFEPSTSDRDRVWKGISSRAGLATVAVALVAKTSAGAAGSSLLAGQSVGALAKLFFTSVAVTLAAGSVVVGVTRLRPAATDRVVVASSPAAVPEPGAAAAPRPAQPPSLAAPSAVLAPELSQVARSEPARAGAPSSPLASAAPGRPEIARELALLQAVRQAASAGQHRHAERLLDELDREFPSGALLEERAALRAIAACEGGSVQRGERGDAFLRRYPSSVYAAKVQRVCGSAATSGSVEKGSTRSFTDSTEPGH